MESNKLTTKEAVKKLVDKVSNVKTPENLSLKLQELFAQLEINSQNEETFWQNYQTISKYIDWIIAIPWFNETKDILDLRFTKEKLDEEHYGLTSIKERILEYISVLALQKNRNPNDTVHAPVLLFVGLVGTGKTTISNSIAKVLGREIIRIPFGGLGDAHYLRGNSRTRPDAEPGQIVKGLVNCKSRNPVILLDEIDRVADDALNTIMGVLVEILDPEQNHHFVDHYLDYPIDLSQVIFCATCNNTSRIATAVMDRLEVIQMPSYTDEEKIIIAKDYLLPKVLKSTGLTSADLQIKNDLWPQIVRPLGFDAGVRTLHRNIEGMCRKVAKIILEGKIKQVIIDESNIKTLLPQW
jgi:ATP-dependent Lon protease